MMLGLVIWETLVDGRGTLKGWTLYRLAHAFFLDPTDCLYSQFAQIVYTLAKSDTWWPSTKRYIGKIFGSSTQHTLASAGRWRN